MYREAAAHTYRLYRKEFITMFTLGAAALLLLLSLILIPSAGATNIGGPSDCDNNAIIRCGVHSTGALKNAYNSSAYVRGVFAEFGINRADIASLDSTLVAGTVTKGGQVFVDGRSKAVASDAVTGGRQDMPGSTRVNHGGAIFYKRPPSVSFRSGSLPAFVAMQNGRFQFAVIASCGNAVAARAVAPPQQHAAIGEARAVSKPTRPSAPTPAVTQVQSQSQSQTVNVSNTNINQNTQNTQIVRQKPAPQAAARTRVAQPSVQTSAAVLPGTGPTGSLGAFLAAVALGTLGYRRLLIRRLER